MKRLVTTLAVLCITAAVALVGFVAWDYEGTNWVSKRAHEGNLSAIQNAWASGVDEVTIEQDSTNNQPTWKGGAILTVPRWGDEFLEAEPFKVV